ncbi:MAG: superoxide dismutase [Cu-Zn] SodC [Rhodospirillales bacterium]
MTKYLGWSLPLAAAVFLSATAARADGLKVPMNLSTQAGSGDSVGDIAIGATAGGAVFKLNLKGLHPGPHGFHVHENGQCSPTTMNGIAIPAGAAGSHWDSDHTNKHAGPEGEGHIGDLPLLIVAEDGTATQTLTAPRIKDIGVLKGHAVVIHLNGDNYSDQPAALGGGGARVACGVIQ